MPNQPVDPQMETAEDSTMQQPQASMAGIDPLTGMPIEPTDGSNAEAVLEKEKFKKLFGLYKDLLDYTDVFIENLKCVNINLLDVKRYQKLGFYIDDLTKLKEKMNSYLINIFNNEKYEKVLYSYILFRTELLTAVKGLRGILKLENPDEKLGEDKN